MNKQEFLSALRNGLSRLPQEDVEERLSFYSEMIDDYIEEGLSEGEAVSEIGTVDEVLAQILSEIPLSKLVKERVKPNRQLRTWEIVLLILGSPVWVSVLLAICAAVLSIYIVIWAVVITLWSVEASFMACSLGAVLSAVMLMLQGNSISGVAMLGAGICCIGLSILLFFGCRAFTKGMLMLTKKIALGIKTLFMGKEKAQ